MPVQLGDIIIGLDIIEQNGQIVGIGGAIIGAKYI